MWRWPARLNASTKRTLSAVAMAVGSFCKPSRGPTSTTAMRGGVLLTAPAPPAGCPAAPAGLPGSVPRRTSPSRGARTTSSIFIASRTTTGSPAVDAGTRAARGWRPPSPASARSCPRRRQRRTRRAPSSATSSGQAWPAANTHGAAAVPASATTSRRPSSAVTSTRPASSRSTRQVRAVDAKTAGTVGLDDVGDIVVSHLVAAAHPRHPRIVSNGSSRGRSPAGEPDDPVAPAPLAACQAAAATAAGGTSRGAVSRASSRSR